MYEQSNRSSHSHSHFDFGWKIGKDSKQIANRNNNKKVINERRLIGYITVHITPNTFSILSQTQTHVHLVDDSCFMHSQRWTLWPVDRLKFIYQTKYFYRNIELISRRISMNAMKTKWRKKKTKSKKKRECNQISTLTLSLASCTYCRVSGRVLSKRLTMCQSPLNWTEQFSFRNFVHTLFGDALRKVINVSRRHTEDYRHVWAACYNYTE